jgi:hypothetical protein
MHQGPVFGSALFVPAQRRSPGTRAKAAPVDAPRAHLERRPIGLGRRAILVTNPAVRVRARALRMKLVARRAARRTPLYAGFLAALLFSAAAFSLSFAVDTPRTLMSRADYVLARQAIESQVRAALGRCRAVEAAARGVCRAQARADERVQKAQLNARYHGTVAAAADVRLARAKASFDVARARCNVLGSSERLQCLQSARASETRMIASARPAAT